MARLVGAPPTDPQDAATKAYVDAILGATSPLTGATVGGNTGGQVVFQDGQPGLSMGGLASLTGGTGELGDLGAQVIAGGGDSGSTAEGFVTIKSFGSTGTAGQVFTTNGNAVDYWADPPAATFLSVAKWA